MPRSEPPRVAVILDRTHPLAPAVLAGILDHAKPRGWRLGDETDAGDADGAIVDAALPARPAKRCVTFSLTRPGGGDVRIDGGAVADLARDHFRQRGYTDPFLNPTELETLPAGPIACYFDTDAAAAAAVRALRQTGRRVPEEVAVLGFGNDPLVCERCPVPLSSIDIGPRRVGRTAAQRLSRVLAGRVATEPTLVPPLSVVERASTAAFAVDDAEVVAAVRFVREHAAGPLRVGDVMRASGLDRRTLERRFARHFGRSPAEAIRRLRVEAAARLLRETSLSMTEVARASGFRLPQHLAASFKAIVGQTPTDYRASMTGDGENA